MLKLTDLLARLIPRNEPEDQKHQGHDAHRYGRGDRMQGENNALRRPGGPRRKQPSLIEHVERQSGQQPAEPAEFFERILQIVRGTALAGGQHRCGGTLHLLGQDHELMLRRPCQGDVRVAVITNRGDQRFRGATRMGPAFVIHPTPAMGSFGKSVLPGPDRLVAVVRGGRFRHPVTGG